MQAPRWLDLVFLAVSVALLVAALILGDAWVAVAMVLTAGATLVRMRARRSVTRR